MSSMDSLTLHNNSEVTVYIFPELGVVCVCVCCWSNFNGLFDYSLIVLHHRSLHFSFGE